MPSITQRGKAASAVEWETDSREPMTGIAKWERRNYMPSIRCAKNHARLSANFFTCDRQVRNMTGKTFALFLAVLVLFPGLIISGWAGVGGRVSGTVKDASGAVVPNANVTATNVDTGVHATATTNGSGFYS
jgi:hypothetical protein